MKRIRFYASVCFILFAFRDARTQSLIVWPGDATNNGIVNNLDFLQLGLAYNYFGPARDSVGGNIAGFSPQAANPWAFSFANGLNFAYADCNGDGVISYNYDAFPIYVHYGAQRPGNITPDVFQHGIPGIDPALHFDAATLPSSVQNGDRLLLPIVLGDAAHPVEDLYGLAFSIKTDPRFVDATDVKLNFSETSWANPDNDRMYMYRPVTGNRVDVSWTRTDQNQRNGYGAIGNAEIIVIIDVLGLQAPDFDLIIEDIRMIDKFGNENVIAGDTLTIALSNQNTSTGHTPGDPETLRIYPNPASEQLYIKADAPITSLRLTDAMGRTVRQQNPNAPAVDIALAGIPKGVYWVDVETLNRRFRKRITVL